jgi:DNA-binding HxlR family transcriptional regulator
VSSTDKAQPSGSNSYSAHLGIDPIVHEPARLMILMILDAVDNADFKFLEIHTEQSPGNLSAQTIKLEQAGYIYVKKVFRGKQPATEYRITSQGRAALNAYWQQMDAWQQSRQNFDEIKQQKERVRRGKQESTKPQLGFP